MCRVQLLWLSRVTPHMEIVLILLLIGGLTFGYQAYQQHRENELAKRLEDLKDPTLASVEVDRLIAQSRRDTDILGKIRDHRW